ncbi:MAG: acyl-CoA desaturase [Chitinophagaceae bacterium]|nr:MAG: acyl-CoA desaturase [Chitinophagaceae bacterium]
MSKFSFNNKNKVFFNDLKRSVDDYFVQNKISKTGNAALYIKAGTLIPAAIAIYIVLLTVPMAGYLGIILSSVLGFILASIGFNVMHDANHGSFSSKKWVNDTFGLTLNALGGNAFIWRFKHNIIHHTYTNVDGIDDDIAKSPLMRQCSSQKWVPAHRFQHIYVVLVYAISSFAWVFMMDLNKYLSKRVYTTQLQKMSNQEHFLFWFSKAMYILFYIVIPVMAVGWSKWAIGFTFMHIFLGFTLAIVFQLAHVVEHTEFESSGIEDKLIENEWAIHQVKTTANFAPKNKVISWFVGGLNFQIEHHLFPRVSHVHYPAISKIVKENCEKHNITYVEFPTMTQAVASHFRFMRELGKKPVVVPVHMATANEGFGAKATRAI